MEDPKFKVAVSTGIWTGAAGGEEMADVVKKLGYALTRGTSAIEIAENVPHEIDFTMGKELRYIAKKQGLDLNLHGSLTVPFAIPEVYQWREAQDHLQKGIKAAVYGGCKYVNFHSCLHFWVEMLTYVGARLAVMMCDWKGRFISYLLKENKETRERFVEKFWWKYQGQILGEEVTALEYRAREEAGVEAAKIAPRERSPEEYAEQLGKLMKEKSEKIIKEALKEHLKKGRPWFLKTRGDYSDACYVIAHYLFYTQDPIWKDMVKMYQDVLKEFKYNFENPTSDPLWLESAFKKAEEEGGLREKQFKEFFYGVVGAKFLSGHLIEAAKWMAEQDEYKGRGLPTIIDLELKTINPPDLKEQKEELFQVLKNLIVCIENPDARDPSYAGRYMLWRPKQIYVAIKNSREELKRMNNHYWDKIMMIIDFEHIATQGVDAIEEIRDLVKAVPDVGKFIICIHSNHPNPLHSHAPIELGDETIYKLLWMLKEAGMGKDHTTYILFERGGFRDPFKRSVTALKLMVKYLKKNVPPEKLPEHPEFYGITGKGLLAVERQWVNIFQHAMDPLRGLLKIPEEEYTFLGRSATEAGKRPEEWKKEEYR